VTPEHPTASGRPRWPHALIVLLAAGGAFLSLPTLMTVSDPLPARADAIYVFPGEIPSRPLCAAELWRRGVAPRIVFTGGSLDHSLAAVGQPMTDAEVGARIARAAGVPEAVEFIVPEGTSTWEDARALADWAEAHEAREIVAVTSPLHSRRARRSLRIALGAAGARVALLACGPRTSGPAWWWDEHSLIAVFVEAAKTILYELRYFLPARLRAS